MSKKSLLKTFILWLIGGFFGLHHFYLGRDGHAFIMWMTYGGFFGLGWLWDLFYLRHYVQDYNEEEEYMKKLARQMKEQSKPSTSTLGFSFMVLVGELLGYILVNALPEELLPGQVTNWALYFGPLGVAIGIHLVGNIGRQQGRFLPTCVAAYVTSPIFYFGYNSLSVTTLFTAFSFNYFIKEWRRAPYPRKSLPKRVFVLVVCGMIYLSLMGSYFYFNCVLPPDGDGEPVKCRDAARNFLKSPIFREFLAVMKDLLDVVMTHGWDDILKEIVEAFDPRGYNSALEVLGVNSSSTESEMTNKYRALSRKWHPDKHKDPKAKEAAEAKFIEIQQAYEIVSQVKAHRLRRNTENVIVTESSK